MERGARRSLSPAQKAGAEVHAPVGHGLWGAAIQLPGDLGVVQQHLRGYSGPGVTCRTTNQRRSDSGQSPERNNASSHASSSPNLGAILQHDGGEQRLPRGEQRLSRGLQELRAGGGRRGRNSLHGEAPQREVRATADRYHWPEARKVDEGGRVPGAAMGGRAVIGRGPCGQGKEREGGGGGAGGRWMRPCRQRHVRADRRLAGSKLPEPGWLLTLTSKSEVAPVL